MSYNKQHFRALFYTHSFIHMTMCAMSAWLSNGTKKTGLNLTRAGGKGSNSQAHSMYGLVLYWDKHMSPVVVSSSNNGNSYETIGCQCNTGHERSLCLLLAWVHR